MTEIILNREQTQAVKHESGPLLIIAGAGTGKTAVIAARIEYLIINKLAKESEILALTFTEKATQEMLERVDQKLHLGHEEIEISTFHSFCDKALKEFGLEIGIDSKYQLLDETELWLMMKRNLFLFELDYYRPLSSPDQFISALISFISRLKDQNIGAEDFSDYVEKLKISNKFDSDEASRLSELAKLYLDYQKLIHESNCLDFGDLHLLVIKMFEKRKNILSEFQRRYKFILVDEFQDTNYAQSLLVELLASEHRNITVVGDDDQSIYKFRGAAVSNIFEFEKNFPGAKKIVLKENYRSIQQILDMSHFVIQNNNPDRLEFAEKIDKKLISKVQFESSETDLLQAVNFEHYLDELRFVADKVSFLIANGHTSSEIAVLVRANAQAQAFLEEFKARWIEVDFISKEPIFAREEVKDLIAFLKFVLNPRDSIALYRLLQSEFFDFEMEELLAFLQTAKQFNITLFEALRKIQPASLFAPEMPEKAENALTFLKKMIESSRSKKATEILGNFIYQETDYLKNLQRKDRDGERQIELIAQFSNLVYEFELKNPKYGLPEFLDYLNLLEVGGKNVHGSARSYSEGVQMMTIHSAKGLEFETVFLPYLAQHKFPTTRRSDQIPVPDDLIRDTLPSGDFHIEEERRLFYVACTRAKKRLFMTTSKFYEGKKMWKRSQFVEEAIQSGKVKEIKFSQNSSLERLHSTLEKKPASANLRRNDYLSFTPRKLSYSQIDSYKTCPYKYKFRYLYQLPSPIVHQTSFGTSVHSTLNQFYKRLQKSAPVSKDLLKEIYENNWLGLGYQSKAHENKRKKSGWECLEKFYEQNSNPWIVPKYLEKGFTLKFGQVSFSGRIDRIDRLEDGSFEVIDYKTGKLKSDTKLEKNMQLSLYALACQTVLAIPLSKLSLYYIESGQKISVGRSKLKMDDFKDELSEIVEHMQNSEFEPTPGFVCKFCEYRLLCHAAEY